MNTAMGWVKNHLMEIQEMGDWPGGLSDKMVCSHHFHDHYLNDIILEKSEGNGKCSYCGRLTKVCSLQKLMEDVTWKIHLYYTRPENASLYLAHSFYDDDEEEIKGFRRFGEFIVPNEAECYDSTELLLEALDAIPDNQELYNDVLSVFETESWISVDLLREDYKSERLLDQWKKFCLIVTSQKRYTFLANPDFLPVLTNKGEKRDILTGLSSIITGQKICRILPTGTKVYRARRVRQDELDKGIDFNNITSPPNEKATPNRMSPAGISMFYASYLKKTAEMECVGDKSLTMIVGTFKTIKPLMVLDLTRIPENSFWMTGWQENMFLHQFNKEITKPVSEDDDNLLQYIPTQVLTEYLRYMYEINGKHLDGIVYGSSKDRNKNLVLFYNQEQSSDVLELDGKIDIKKA